MTITGKKIVLLAALAAVLVGCEREPQAPEAPKPEVYPAEGNAYMKDPAFKKDLDASVRVRNVILAERRKLLDEQKAIVEKHKGDLAAASNDVAWVRNAIALKQNDAKLDDRQKSAEDLARKRINQAIEDSKRIKAGTAVPKK